MDSWETGHRMSERMLLFTSLFMCNFIIRYIFKYIYVISLEKNEQDNMRSAGGLFSSVVTVR